MPRGNVPDGDWVAEDCKQGRLNRMELKPLPGNWRGCFFIQNTGFLGDFGGLLTKKESLATMLSALKKLEMEKFGSTRKKILERGLIFPIAAPPRFLFSSSAEKYPPILCVCFG